MPAWQPVYKLIAQIEEWLGGLLSAVSGKSAFKTPLSIGEKTWLPSSGLDERGGGEAWTLSGAWCCPFQGALQAVMGLALSQASIHSLQQ